MGRGDGKDFKVVKVFNEIIGKRGKGLRKKGSGFRRMGVGLRNWKGEKGLKGNGKRKGPRLEAFCYIRKYGFLFNVTGFDKPFSNLDCI